MESVKTRVIKTKSSVGHSNGSSVSDGRNHKGLKNESKVLRTDYQLLSDHSESWLDSCQEMQTKWEILANTIANFGNGLYVDNGPINELSQGFHRLHNLMYPIIKTTKIGIHDNAESISQQSVGKLKKQNHLMENNKVRADNANHKLDKYKSKPKTNPSTLKKKEVTAEKATIVYDESYRKYQHDIRDLEYKSVDNLHFSRQLLFDLQDFFNKGFVSVHSLRERMETLRVQEKLHSRYGLINQDLPETYVKYQSTWKPMDHCLDAQRGSVIFDDKEDEDLTEIKETTVINETTTTTYQVPVTDSQEGTSSSFQKLSLNSCNDDEIINSPAQQQTFISSSTITDQDFNKTYSNSPSADFKGKQFIAPTVLQETRPASLSKETTTTTLLSPKIVDQSDMPRVENY